MSLGPFVKPIFSQQESFSGMYRRLCLESSYRRLSCWEVTGFCRKGADFGRGLQFGTGRREQATAHDGYRVSGYSTLSFSRRVKEGIGTGLG